ncbi:hypothetical protein [Halovivax gelatinilyticus]|uniref:hypothetical protein n=1 Tax=Halovivax gelatinilyticus TaxID=2961597 RepID=UPI0020CA3062|nr:hypothetical protein [Halovivax gelatinilyticus]
MQSVSITSNRIAPALAVGCFATASLLFEPNAAIEPAILATALLAAGVLLLAAWSKSISRTEHAMAAIGAWILAVGGSSLYALAPIVEAGIATGALAHLTMSAALCGIVTTVYLGFREYGSRAPMATSEDVLDRDPEY